MISVCIATHNGEKYIKKQLESILIQLTETDEVIVSDDGSVDNTINIISGLKDERIKVIKKKDKNDYSKRYLSAYYYASDNFNNALLASKGDYIFLADQDDIWISNKVEVFLHYLKEYDLVCSNFSIIDEHDKIVKERYSDRDFNAMSFLEVLKELPFRGCCLAFNRKVLLNSQPFPKNLFLHDCWIGLNAIVSGFRYYYVDTPLLLYRRHSCNVSSIQSPNSLSFKLKYRIILLFQIMKLRFTRMYR